MLRTARPMRARTLRSDGKDYRADYEHDDLSPNNVKPPNAPKGNGPLCETYERERNPNVSCQWHSEILQSFARLRLYLAGGRRQRRLRPCLRARALRRSGAQRGRQGLLRDRGRQARARQASCERAARLNLSPPRLILNRQAKPAGFFYALMGCLVHLRPAARDQASCRIASGVIGVLRRRASSAAMSNDTPMPATQASQPNRSKSWPRTAAPMSPPKK